MHAYFGCFYECLPLVYQRCFCVGQVVYALRVSAVERLSNALLYSWASLRWAQLIRKPSLMSATLCSTFSVVRLILSSCATRAQPIEQTTQLSPCKLNRFSKEHGSLQKHLICAYPSNRYSQKSEWHSMNVPLGRHPNELHNNIMVVTPRKFLRADGEVERRERERERERETGKRLERERSWLLRGRATL